MAKARGSAPDPPAESEEESGEEASSSSSEENAAGSESESESEPESKQTDNAQPNKKPPSAPVHAAKFPNAQTADTSSEEDGSGSESESDSPHTKPDPTIKPIASKPVDDAQKVTSVKKPRSKPNKASLSSPTKPNSAAGSKRPSSSETGADGEVKETKRSRKVLEKGFDESEKKNKLFQRLWSEEDELAILKGMADFSANKKADPVANIDAFHEFIKKSIHVDVIRTQLQDKIRRLRKKYESNSDKEKQGKGKIFTNDHEQKAFELSKTVWGNETSSAGRRIGSPKFNGDVVIRGPSKNANAKTPVIEVGEEGDKGGKNAGGSKGFERLKSVNFGAQKLGTEEWIMENSIHLVDGEKRAKMDEKWKRFRMEEAEMYAKKLELMHEEAKLVLDALKSSIN